MQHENENGSLEWIDQEGKRCTRAVNRLMIRWSDGTLSGPVAFGGQLVVGHNGEDVAWIFQAPPPRKNVIAAVLGWWGTHSRALVLGGLLGAAVYRNVAYFWG